MDLNAVVGPVIAAVLPPLPVTVRISIGQSATAADGTRAPGYATPGAITASIAGDTLTVTGQTAGLLQPGQTVSGAGVVPSTLITQQLSGTPGGPGNYLLNNEQTVGSVAMTTLLVLRGNVQPMSARDLRQVEGLNLAGVQWKVYLHGEVDSIVRAERKGGDLVVIPSGPHAGTWLVTVILEQFPDWCCAGIVLQNGA
jgi:hypothetical protein